MARRLCMGMIDGGPGSYINLRIIHATPPAFDDFAAGGIDRAVDARMMGIG
jgi:hypothetical protein